MYGPDDAYYRRVQRWSCTAAYRAELEALASALELEEGDRVLDLGCGTGTAIDLLARRRLRLVGLDRSPVWRRHCPVRPVLQADALSLPFPGGLFHGVLLMHVIAHLVRPAESLQEIRRVLRPGGRLGLLTPNARFLQAMGGAAAGYRPDPTVERHFTLEELQELVQTAGFSLQRAAAWGRRPLRPRAATKDEPGLEAPRERILLVASAGLI